MTLPPPPVPQKLREILKDYPEHIERLQEVLNYVVETPSRGVDPFDRAIWVLESRLGTFISEARKELEATETNGAPEAIAQAKEKRILMSRAHSRNGGMRGLDDLWEYFQTNKKAFE